MLPGFNIRRTDRLSALFRPDGLLKGLRFLPALLSKESRPCLGKGKASLPTMILPWGTALAKAREPQER